MTIFATAVCLTEEGKVQAKGIGQLLKEIIFGYYNKIDKNLLRTGV